MALGFLLGFLITGSPVWFAVLAVVLIFRTQLFIVAVSALCGFAVSMPIKQLYESSGTTILIANEPFWQNICSKPFVCYLNLNNAQIMGSVVWAFAFSIVVFAVLFVLLKKSRNSVLRQIKQSNNPTIQ